MVGHILSVAAESHSTAEAIGRITGFALFPALGLLLLVLGLRRRGKSGREADQPIYPAYPGPPAPPYGAQYPGAPEAVPYPQYPPLPGPPVNKSGGTVLIVVGSVLFAFSLLGILGSLALGGSTSALRGLTVGQCISEKDYAAEKMASDAIDCQRDDAVYELASKGDGSATCPDGKRDDSSYAVLTNRSQTYCFTLNVREGACYHIEVAKNVFTPVACTSNDATAKIERRVDGSTDVTQCAPGTKGVTLPEPPRLFCVGSP